MRRLYVALLVVSVLAMPRFASASFFETIEQEAAKPQPEPSVLTQPVAAPEPAAETKQAEQESAAEPESAPAEAAVEPVATATPEAEKPAPQPEAKPEVVAAPIAEKAETKTEQEVVIPSKEINPMLAQYADTENDPYKENPLSYLACQVPEVDEFLRKATLAVGTFGFSRYLLAKTQVAVASGTLDKGEAQKRMMALMAVLYPLGGQVQELAKQGEDLSMRLPLLLSGKLAVKLPIATDTIDELVKNLQRVPDQTKKALEQVTALTAKLAAP